MSHFPESSSPPAQKTSLENKTIYNASQIKPVKLMNAARYARNHHKGRLYRANWLRFERKYLVFL